MRDQIELIIDRSFYQNETGLLFESRADAVEHFLRIGQYNDFSPNSIIFWPWVKSQIASKEIGFVQWLELRKIVLHPLFEPSMLVPHFENFRLVDIVRVLSRRLVSKGPFSKYLISLLTKRELETPLSDFLKPYTGHRHSQPSEDQLLFSSEWYLDAYRDVENSGVNPFFHFITKGWRELRDPSPEFSIKEYLRENQDLAVGAVNPYLHYLFYGHDEGRKIRPTLQTEMLVKHQVNRGKSPPSFVHFTPDNPSQFSECLDYMVGIKILIVVPFYKAPQLVARVLGSLFQVVGELHSIECGVVCINDSPGDDELVDELNLWLVRLSKAGVKAALVFNERNRGFIYSANVGIYLSRMMNSHCLLLNSDTIVFGGAISELLSVSQISDRIGFVNPRSNNATIATFGSTAESNWRRTHSYFVREAGSLPRISIVPTAVGFCLFMKSTCTRRFGFLDQIYGRGYNEENDYIMRANRLGYISVLANRAFVAHIGEQSFSLLEGGRPAIEGKNAEILQKRYPEYLRSIRRYFFSDDYALSKIMETDHNTFDIVFDLSGIPLAMNGTIRLVKLLLPILCERMKRRKIAVICSQDVKDLIVLPSLVTVKSPGSHVFGKLGMRFSQPFNLESFRTLSQRCNRIGFFMLDSISLDCLYLNKDDLQRVWTLVFDYGDFVIFNSSYTESIFRSRFVISEELTSLVSYHSLRLSEYSPETPADVSANGSDTRVRVLIVGNDFCHKALRIASQELNHPEVSVRVFGADLGLSGSESFRSGFVSSADLERLWSWSQCVVFPSFYEGFGFPILEALARGRPVVVMENPLFRSMWERLSRPEAIVFVDSLDDLHSGVMKSLTKRRPDISVGDGDGWNRSAEEICALLNDQLVKPCDHAKVRRRLVAGAAVHLVH